MTGLARVNLPRGVLNFGKTSQWSGGSHANKCRGCTKSWWELEDLGIIVDRLWNPTSGSGNFAHLIQRYSDCNVWRAPLARARSFHPHEHLPLPLCRGHYCDGPRRALRATCRIGSACRNGFGTLHVPRCGLPVALRHPSRNNLGNLHADHFSFLKFDLHSVVNSVRLSYEFRSPPFPASWIARLCPISPAVSMGRRNTHPKSYLHVFQWL